MFLCRSGASAAVTLPAGGGPTLPSSSERPGAGSRAHQLLSGRAEPLSTSVPASTASTSPEAERDPHNEGVCSKPSFSPPFFPSLLSLPSLSLLFSSLSLAHLLQCLFLSFAQLSDVGNFGYLKTSRPLQRPSLHPATAEELLVLTLTFLLTCFSRHTFRMLCFYEYHLDFVDVYYRFTTDSQHFHTISLCVFNPRRT